MRIVPSAKTTLLVSHLPWLWKTVINPGWPLRLEGGDGPGVVHRQVAVAVKDDERARRATGSARLIAPPVPSSFGPSKEYSSWKPCALPSPNSSSILSPRCPTQITALRRPWRVQQPKLVRQKRLARHRHERLGDRLRDGSQPRRQSARQQRDGPGSQIEGAQSAKSKVQTTIFVPSKSKRKRTSLHARLAHGVAQLRLVVGVEHQEAAAARADELAAQRAVGHGGVVPFVDLRVAHAAAAFLLALPMHVHQPGELLQVATFERGLALETEVFDEVQVLDHALVGALALVVLLLEDFGGRTRVAREEKQQVVFEVEKRLLAGLERPRFHLAVGQEVGNR